MEHSPAQVANGSRVISSGNTLATGPYEKALTDGCVGKGFLLVLKKTKKQPPP